MRLSDLPCDYWDRESISEIGAIIRRLIAVDACSEALLKGAFFQLCVEIDITKPLVPRVPLRSQTTLIGWSSYMRILGYFASNMGSSDISLQIVLYLQIMV